jgi:hypothetical protein
MGFRCPDRGILTKPIFIFVSPLLTNRPKNIKIHLALSRVRFYLLRFNSSGNFCDSDAILLQRNSLSQSAPQALETVAADHAIGFSSKSLATIAESR